VDERRLPVFVLIGEYLAENGLKASTGTIVDATIINAPSSTKNKDKARDPEMHQTRKGNQWYFGMKAHIGVDSHSKIIHSVALTAANVHDSRMLPDLLHVEETRVWGDSAYTGQGDVIRTHAPRARDFTQNKACRNKPLTDIERSRNRTKSKVRSSGTPFFNLQTNLRFSQSALPGAYEKRRLYFCNLRTDKSLHGATATLKSYIGDVSQETKEVRKKRSKAHSRGYKKPSRLPFSTKTTFLASYK